MSAHKLLGWLFSPQPRAPWVWLMAITTGAYLLVECGFNSRLLDVVGGMPNHTTVANIEVRGRLISGVAVALMFWPALLKFASLRHWHWVVTAAAIGAVSIPAVALTYLGELWLVDKVVERSSAEQRYLAVNLLTVQNALVVGGVELDDLPLTRAELAAPDGKTFLAVFPLLAYSTRDLEKKIREQKPIMLRAVTDHTYGGLDRNYNGFLTSREKLIKRYNDDYLKGCDEYNRALARIAGDQQRAWSDYTGRLARNGLTPDRVPPAYWRKVRSDLRSRGVPVTSNWDPGDRGGFERALAARVHQDAAQRFRTAIARHFDGAAVAPNLGKQAFFFHPVVQDSWRKQLHYQQTGVLLPIDLPANKDAPRFFERTVYSKVLDWHVRDKLKKYSAAADAFADGGQYQALGLESMRAMAVPPIALAFSILGALVHVIKLSLFLIQLAFARGFTYGSVKAVCVPALALGLLGAFYFIPGSQIVRQPLFEYFEERGATLGGNGQPDWKGRAVVFYARSVINVQPVAYPIFEAVRVHVLRDYKFGYEEQFHE